MGKYQLQLTGDQVAQLLSLIQALGGRMENGESLLTPEQQELLQEKVNDGRISSLAELLDFMDGIGEGETLHSLLQNAQGLSPEDKELLDSVREAMEDGSLVDDRVVENKVNEFLHDKGVASDADIDSIFGNVSESVPVQDGDGEYDDDF